MENKEELRGMVKGIDFILNTFCHSEFSPEARKKINFYRLELLKRINANDTKEKEQAVDRAKSAIRTGRAKRHLSAAKVEKAKG